MKNRAKCKLCNSIIESFHATDYVMCKCEEIALDGGDALYCFARDFKNFVRVDDEDNEVIVTMKEDVKPLDMKKPSKEDLLAMLDEHIKSYERLPEVGLYSYVTQADLLSSLLLLQSILRS